MGQSLLYPLWVHSPPCRGRRKEAAMAGGNAVGNLLSEPGVHRRPLCSRWESQMKPYQWLPVQLDDGMIVGWAAVTLGR
jgi:hypothetical protein